MPEQKKEIIRKLQKLAKRLDLVAAQGRPKDYTFESIKAIVQENWEKKYGSKLGSDNVAQPRKTAKKQRPVNPLVFGPPREDLETIERKQLERLKYVEKPKYGARSARTNSSDEVGPKGIEKARKATGKQIVLAAETKIIKFRFKDPGAIQLARPARGIRSTEGAHSGILRKKMSAKGWKTSEEKRLARKKLERPSNF